MGNEPISSPPRDFIAAMLRTPIQVVEVNRSDFAAGKSVRDEVVMTNRCILVLAGSLEYEVERDRTTIQAGSQLLVPNWVRRSWRTSTGCEIAWVDFATTHMDTSPLSLFWRKPKNLSLEKSTMARMLTLWKQRAASMDSADLVLEGEVKAVLGRFWSGAQANERDAFAKTHFAESLHPEVRRAAAWLSEHFAQSDAVASFYQTLVLSPDYFRRQFQEAYGENMQTRLNRIRLRQARFLVHESSLSLKEIAAACGFADPLFFSRQYRKFWGAAPSQERVKA